MTARSPRFFCESIACKRAIGWILRPCGKPPNVCEGSMISAVSNPTGPIGRQACASITHLAVNRFRADWIWLDVEADGFFVQYGAVHCRHAHQRGPWLLARIRGGPHFDGSRSRTSRTNRAATRTFLMRVTCTKNHEFPSPITRKH